MKKKQNEFNLAKFTATVVVISLLGMTAMLIKLKISGLDCLIKELTGLPCPTCGMTRAYKSLLRGEILMAFIYNPAFLTYPAAIVFCILTLISKKHKRLFAILFFLVIFILFAVWFIRLINGSLFIL